MVSMNLLGMVEADCDMAGRGHKKEKKVERDNDEN